MQCEFTNELRTYRKKIPNICNQIAVEIRSYFLFRPGSIQSAVGRVSERLFCAFTNAVDILFALSITDIIFRPENTVNANACNRTRCSVFRPWNEFGQFFLLPQASDDVDVYCYGYRNDVLGMVDNSSGKDKLLTKFVPVVKATRKKCDHFMIGSYLTLSTTMTAIPFSNTLMFARHCKPSKEFALTFPICSRACRVLYCKQAGAERMGDLARDQYRRISR